MTSDITYSRLLFGQCSRARQCTSKKKNAKKEVRSITRSGTTDPRVRHCQTELSNSLLKLCPRLFLPSFSPSLPSPSLLMPPSLRSIIVEHRSRRARYKCPSLSGSRNPQQLSRRVSRYLPPPLSSLSAPFPPVLSFVLSRPKLNTLESERLNLSAITRSFPSSSIKASQDGSRRFGRTFERRLILGIDGTNISAESVTARVCVSVDGNSPAANCRRSERKSERVWERGRIERKKEHETEVLRN